MIDIPETPKNPVNRIDSDALSAPVLSISRDKCRLILGDIDLADFETTMGASKTITETTSQTIVSFPITRRNSNVLQVTGTDNRIWTFTAELRGDKAKEKKSFLQRLLNTGLPVPFELYMKDGVHKVLIRNLTFRLITECHIEYDIELIEYTPEYLYQVGTNLISAFPEFTGDIADASQNADEPGKAPCSFMLFKYLSSEKAIEIPLNKLVGSGSGGDISLQTSLFAAYTTCYSGLLKDGVPLTPEEVEKKKKQYEKVKSKLSEIFNAIWKKIDEYLSSSVVKFGTDISYDWQAKCRDKYASAYPEEYEAMKKELLEQIFNSDCCYVSYKGYVGGDIGGHYRDIKVPLFEKTSNSGLFCFSSAFVDALAKEGFAGILYICQFQILILGDCINWCNGKTEDTLPPEDPRPPLPGSDPIAE